MHTHISAHTSPLGDKGPCYNYMSYRQTKPPPQASQQTAELLCWMCITYTAEHSGRRPPAAKPLPHRWPWWKGNPPSWPYSRRARQTAEAALLTTTQEGILNAPKKAYVFASGYGHKEQPSPLHCSLSDQFKPTPASSINFTCKKNPECSFSKRKLSSCLQCPTRWSVTNLNIKMAKWIHWDFATYKTSG